MRVRQAREDDVGAVTAFTRDTWAEFDAGDYVPDVFAEWVATDGPDQRTVVAERGGEVVGVCQVVLLSAHEAWTQGIRVHPDHRGSGVGRALNDACFEWARDRGATVCRNMVFSWNEQGMATSRSLGYDARAEFRWAVPEPESDLDADPDSDGGGVDADPDAGGSDGTPADGEFEVVDDPDGAWAYWQRSEARDALGGLGLDLDESWALSERTRERFRRAAEETALLAVRGGGGTRGVAYLAREDAPDDESGPTAVYGAAGWADRPAADALFDAVERDAADRGAEGARVLIPETPRHVSDAAAVGVALDDDPDFVFEADLSGRGQ
ncbi:MAG: N-acetyltransferase family protein [Haloarculaceae archaeon]